MAKTVGFNLMAKTAMLGQHRGNKSSATTSGCEIGKLEHLTGATKKPPEDDPTFQNWDLEDSIVIAWLINSMELKIGQMYLFLPTAKEV
ncbi:hypothetical protein CK203_032003 [Vitis vinifera]|nr:hypothetical protein CK203_032003 [Vitis vinifera]